MSETVLDVLMYLFETYSEQDLETEPEPDQGMLRKNSCKPDSASRKSTVPSTGSTA